MNNALVKCRAKSGMTAKEVAELLDISLSSYVKYERNERVPRDGMKMKIAKLYKTSVTALFFTQ